MCGIIAVLPSESSGPSVSAADLLAGLEGVRLDLGGDLASLRSGVVESELRLRELDAKLRGAGTTAGLLADRPTLGRLAAEAQRVLDEMEVAERLFDSGGAELDEQASLQASAELLAAWDAAWSVAEDRIEWARSVAALVGDGPVGPEVVRAYGAIETALRALDKLEVRGRDSAGIQVWVAGDLAGLDETVEKAIAARTDPLYRSGAVEPHGQGICFVYKTAAAIGRLRDNSTRLRRAIEDDAELRAVLSLPGVRVSVLGHTRWASVGRINEANAHPHNDNLDGERHSTFVSAALNGDIDNHLALRRDEGIETGADITTDGKLIPVVVARRVASGHSPLAAFADGLAEFTGSFAIAAQADPDELLLEVKGSGQGLYIGLAPDAWVVASEPYGVVADTARYVRLDGARGAGTVVRLHRDGVGDPSAVERYYADMRPWPVTERDVVHADMTTRDIALCGFDHYLLKEIAEAPRSVARTLRGRIQRADGRRTVRLGEQAFPRAVADRAVDGSITRVFLIGQGTAAVACRGIAQFFQQLLGSRVRVEALAATEFSAWRVSSDLSDACVVAVSQSGTTTDTNRAVDLAKAKGATVLAVVNRRGSDLAAKADGVLYTSNGRDIEMAVASTKAFYTQVSAGLLLALEWGRRTGAVSESTEDTVLAAIDSMPALIGEVLSDRAQYRAAAELAVARRHWAVVGSGANAVAAAELRIKLSELCYKSVAVDAAEDKKHIDLSAEAMILVCAAGARGALADDLDKEVQIFAAHNNPPVVIASADSATRFTAAAHRIVVPATEPMLGWLLGVVAGHLFAYECAAAIDRAADDLREALDDIARAATEVPPPGVDRFLRAAREGRYDAALTNGTSLRLQLAALATAGDLDLDRYAPTTGEVPTAEVLRRDLEAAVSLAVDELTRSIDTVKHQAKTVTVGTSRSTEDLVGATLVRELAGRGVPRESLPFSTLRLLAALTPAVAAVNGFIRYEIHPDGDRPRVEVIHRDGIAGQLVSRVESDHELRGTKRLVADSRHAVLARGASDGRLVLIVPEVRDGHTERISLLHVDLVDRLDAGAMQELLAGFDRDRLEGLAALVSERDASFDPGMLERVPVEQALLAPLPEVVDDHLLAPGEPS